MLGSASVGACQHAQVNRHACFYVYLCASVLVQVYVNGYLCLYTHMECLYVYKPVHVFVHTSAQASVSIHLCNSPMFLYMHVILYAPLAHLSL